MHDLVKLKRRFLTHLTEERGRSEVTVERYDRYLDTFFSYTNAKTVSDLTVEHVRTFRRYLSRQTVMVKNGERVPMKRSTQNYYLTALRTFLSYLQAEGINTIAMEQVQLHGVRASQPKSVSAELLKKLLTVQHKSSTENLRDQALIELLLSTGMQTAKLCAANITDIDWDQSEIMVPSSTDKDQSRYQLSRKTMQAISTYLQTRADTHPALFLRHGRKQNDGTDARINPRMIQRIVKRRALEAGITHTVTPQIIRNTVRGVL